MNTTNNLTGPQFRFLAAMDASPFADVSDSRIRKALLRAGFVREEIGQFSHQTHLIMTSEGKAAFNAAKAARQAAKAEITTQVS